jgi:hypothetical protein
LLKNCGCFCLSAERNLRMWRITRSNASGQPMTNASTQAWLSQVKIMRLSHH